MAYTPTVWTDRVTKLGPTNLNKLEQGVVAAAATADNAPNPAGYVSGEVPVSNGSAWARSSVTNINPLNIAGGWQAYVPALSASSGGASLGNGTIAGRWTQIGKTVFAYMSLVLGSSTSLGSGTSWLGVPVNMRPPVGGPLDTKGTGLLFDSSAGSWFTCTAMYQAAGFVGLFTNGQPSGVVSAPSVPFVWAVNDQVSFQVVYEAA